MKIPDLYVSLPISREEPRRPMRKLPDDPMGRDFGENIWRYEIPDGQIVILDRDQVRKHGAHALIRHLGLEPFAPGEEGSMIPVFQEGVKVGVVGATFDPETYRSASLFHSPRAGDFRREGDRWIASPSLCPGDLDAIPHFRRVRILEAPPCDPAEGEA